MELHSNLSAKARQDYLIVQRAIAGDQKAYEELFKRYRDAIYYMLLKMVNNKVDAEDLTFEAFGKAFRNLKQYSPNFAFSTWFFKIASNNCIDFLRKKRSNTVSIDGRYSEETEGSYVLTLVSDGLTPEQSIVREQEARIMREKVSLLKERYRKLVELRYFKEYSYEEIAVELDLPLGTVKAQLFRARELLYKLMQNTEIKLEWAKVC